MDTNEKNFIEQPYKKRLMLLYFVPIFIVVQVVLVIFCIVQQGINILIENNLEIMFMKILELLLSVLIFMLEIQEFQYFRNVYLKKFTIFYCNFMSHKRTYIIIKLIFLLYLLYFIGEIMILLEIQGYSFLEHQQPSFCDCNFFGASKQIYQYLIFTLYFTGQTIMMYNVYMIYSTLQLLDNQNDNMTNFGVKGNQVEVLVKNDGTLIEVQSTHNLEQIQQENVQILQGSQESQNSQQLKNKKKKKKKLICLICFSTIKKQVRYCELPCKHAFHRYCLEQLEKSQNFLLKCIVCHEHFEIENISSICYIN